MSRFTPPGDIISGSCDGYHHLVIVTATSRHKRSIDTLDARALLAADAIRYVLPAWDDRAAHEAAMETVARLIDTAETVWFSVTQAEIDEERHEMCPIDWDHAPGEWCPEGQGAAWMKVLYISTTAVEELLAAAGEQAPEGDDA